MGTLLIYIQTTNLCVCISISIYIYIYTHIYETYILCFHMGHRNCPPHFSAQKNCLIHHSSLLKANIGIKVRSWSKTMLIPVKDSNNRK